MDETVITPKTKDLLLGLSSIREFDSFHLVGGTALALQIGHRKSEDLDFFTATDFKTSLLRNIHYPFKTITAADNLIELIVQGDIKLMFMYFGYPLSRRVIVLNKVRLADPVDIGLMKLLAISGRNAKKDIIDLYFIDKEIIVLEKLLEIFMKSYPTDSTNIYDSSMRLLDLEVLSGQPMPEMIRKVDWEEAYNKVKTKIETFFKKELFSKN